MGVVSTGEGVSFTDGSGGGGGDVSANGTLTSGKLIEGNGASEIQASSVSTVDVALLSGSDFTGTVTGISSSDVGLANVDNTSDSNKPISTATQTALDGKVTGPVSAVSGNIATYNGTTGKIIQDGGALNASAVGLGNVDNTTDLNKPVSTDTQTALDGKAKSSAWIFREALEEMFNLDNNGYDPSKI